MKFTIFLILAAFLSISALSAKPKKSAKPKQNSYQERFNSQVKQTADSEARLDKWYRDAKYGAFIHFGVYSMMGG